LRRLAAGALALLAAAASCDSGPPSPFDGFRDLDDGHVIEYRVAVDQQRVATGLGTNKQLSSSVRLDLEEEATGDESYAIVVRAVQATGEESQRVAAQRLHGRRLDIDLGDGVVRGVSEAFSGTQDIAAADIAVLSVLLAPVLPSHRVETGDKWRTRAEPMRVPWSRRPLRFTISTSVTARGLFHHLDTARVDSVALANVSFRLPLIAPRVGGGGRVERDDLIVNQLFESLFSDIDNPIEGFAAAIAAIPLAIAAPFLAFGEALGNLFGGGSDEPEQPSVPVVDLAGPFELRTESFVWIADGRVLEARSRGVMHLAGRMPDLPGRAADLSDKTLRLDVTWSVTRTHTSAFPEPRNPPGRGWVPILAAVLVALALALTIWRSRA
jgi:hypothetical protein